MKKYYAHAYNSQTLRSVKADSDEEALEKFKEIFGDDNFVAGTLPHAEPKIPWKERRKYYAAGLSAAGADEAIGPAMRMIDKMHEYGAV